MLSAINNRNWYETIQKPICPQLTQQKTTGGGGIRTPLGTPDTLLQEANKRTTEIIQSIAFTDTYENSQNTDFEQKLTVPEHCLNTFLHQKCALCVPKNLPADLKELINKWHELPENIRESITLLVKSATM